MRRLLTISIDTEVDRSPDWRVSEDESFRSITFGIPGLLSPLFRRYAVRPTYLLSSEVIENGDCVATLRELADAELGTHLHGDLVEPFRTVEKLGGTYNHAMQCSYSEDVERAKMANLTDSFEKSFGYRPTSFRAGRFAAGRNTCRILEELSYRVDSSVTPGVRWDYPEGRADFTFSPTQPYFASPRGVERAGESSILEVPVSIMAPRVLLLIERFASRSPRSLLRRVSRRMWGVTWLRPSYSDAATMIELVETLVVRSRSKSIVVANMMFHSMEIVPGASPYARNERECAALLGRIESVLAFCSRAGFESVTLSDLYSLYR